MKKEILGIMRDKKFSPNHVENDALIMKLTAKELEQHGFIVKLIYEGSFKPEFHDFEYIFSMARRDSTLKMLDELIRRGATVLNTPTGVRNACRENMTPLMLKHELPYPKSIVVDNANFNSSLYEQFGTKKVWLKSENHTLHREDVTPVFSKEECESTIREFNRRRIKQSLLQEHKVGSEIKFYGVRDSEFFFWYYTNGLPHYKFDDKKLNNISNNVSNLLDLDIFGGDAIVSEKGEISIIDFNDWPSFAPVKNEASKAIANCILKKINGK